MRPSVPGRGPNVWLMSVLFTLLFVAGGAGLYWMLRRPGGTAAAPGEVKMENVSAKGVAASSNPLQKFVEVTGIRLVQDKAQRTQARFLIVNHSAAELTDLSGTVTLWGRTQKSEEESVGSFSFKVASLGPYESRDISAPVDTKLRVYELPDWQNLTGELQLSSP
jgi:hypothetical protein